jgi:hypothetical protein
MLVKQYDALISGLEASLGDVTDEGPSIDATQDASQAYQAQRNKADSILFPQRPAAQQQQQGQR